MSGHHPAQFYDEDDIRQVLDAAIAEAGTQSEFAKRIGVSVPFVNDTYRGKRAVTGKVLEALGFERVVLYRPIDAQHAEKPSETACFVIAQNVNESERFR